MFNKKNVLITGATRGIGRSIAELFAKNNAKIAGTSRSKEGAQKISNYLGNKGKGYILNIEENESINNTLLKINKEIGDINILINNIGIINDNLVLKIKDKEWNKVININLTSIFNLSKFIISSMIKKRYGRIISIGSVIGMLGNIGQSHYAAAKAGIIAFSKSLAREVATRGITVNVVSPGFIETDFIKLLTNKQRIKILSNIPIGRLGYPKEIASAVIFLASDGASYITGETLHVNGGMYMI